MRILCNFLIGLPIFGVIGGSLLLIAQDFFGSPPESWLACRRLLDHLPMNLDSNPAVLQAAGLICDLPLGAHIAIASFIFGLAAIPTGLIIYRIKGLDDAA